jgi:hypothetical protein
MFSPQRTAKTALLNGRNIDVMLFTGRIYTIIFSHMQQKLKVVSEGI